MEEPGSSEAVPSGKKERVFNSPTRGRMTFEAMMRDIVDYIKGLPASSCKIIIGSDSQVKSDTCFITAVIVHRLGKGARYYYRKKIHRKIISLRQKIFYETALSLEVGGMVHRYFAVEGLDDLDVEIHIDVGVHGETRILSGRWWAWLPGAALRPKSSPTPSGLPAWQISTQNKLKDVQPGSDICSASPGAFGNDNRHNQPCPRTCSAVCPGKHR